MNIENAKKWRAQGEFSPWFPRVVKMWPAGLKEERNSGVWCPRENYVKNILTTLKINLSSLVSAILSPG